MAKRTKTSGYSYDDFKCKLSEFVTELNDLITKAKCWPELDSEEISEAKQSAFNEVENMEDAVLETLKDVLMDEDETEDLDD